MMKYQKTWLDLDADLRWDDITREKILQGLNWKYDNADVILLEMEQQAAQSENRMSVPIYTLAAGYRVIAE
jgi:hypothetical protein